jgi:DNA-binding NarL/FixJ family response regulator
VTLVREVSASLPERKCDILALYSSGHKRPKIASHLGLSERAVKRDLLEIMDEARAAIARCSGPAAHRAPSFG